MAGPEDTDDSNSTKASTGGRCLVSEANVFVSSIMQPGGCTP